MFHSLRKERSTQYTVHSVLCFFVRRKIAGSKKVSSEQLAVSSWPSFFLYGFCGRQDRDVRRQMVRR